MGREVLVHCSLYILSLAGPTAWVYVLCYIGMVYLSLSRCCLICTERSTCVYRCENCQCRCHRSDSLLLTWAQTSKMVSPLAPLEYRAARETELMVVVANCGFIHETG